MAESIGLASGHPPAWFDTEDDGLGNWAGKVIGVSRSALGASVPGDFGGCPNGLIWEITGRPDIPLARPVGSVESRWPARQAARKACAGETASILIGGVVIGRYGAAANDAERQLVDVTGRGKTSHEAEPAGVKRPSAAWHLLLRKPWTSGDRRTSAGDSQPPQNVAPVGCWHLRNAGGWNFQNPPARPFGCVHNIAHLGLPRQGAGSQGGRSEGCVGQCFAPAGAGASWRDGAE